MTSESIKSFIIEHRPRLQCANFFLQFSEGLIGGDQEREKINVILSESSVEISRQVDEDDLGEEEAVSEGTSNMNNKSSSKGRGVVVVSIEGHLDVLTNSLSALVARDGYLSFRVNTNAKSFGMEVLGTPGMDRLHGFKKLAVNVTADKEYLILCSNCTGEVGRGRWTRIFELPSENFDSGDWFCHKHVSFDVSSPKVEELFYGYYYALVNLRVLAEERVVTKTQLVYCKRCLQFLGQRTGEEGQGVRVWNENAMVKEVGEQKEAAVNVLQGRPSLMGNFQNLIRKIIHDFEFVDKFTCLLPTMHKLLVKSIRTDSSKEVPSVHLLVQVMDMGLDILQWQGGVLRKQCAMKLLYCFVDSAEEDQMLKYWENDQNVHPLQVSPKMFEELLQTLRDNSKLVPGVYRHNYGFDLSYLFVEAQED